MKTTKVAMRFECNWNLSLLDWEKDIKRQVRELIGPCKADKSTYNWFIKWINNKQGHVHYGAYFRNPADATLFKLKFSEYCD